MERLTVNKPVEEMGMYELAHNCCYVGKEGAARYRDFDTDIDARDFARKLMVKFGLWKSAEKYGLDADNELIDDDIFDDTMFDNLQWVDSENMSLESLITLFYRNLWAMADLYAKLKNYEDAEEQELQCKPGDTVWCIEGCDGEFEVSGYLFIATCMEFVIVTPVYVPCERFEAQLIEMTEESLDFDGISVRIFEKEAVFLTREEAEQALVEMEKGNSK